MVFSIPEFKSIFASHPNELIRETFNSFLGVPSGLLQSQIISPLKFIFLQLILQGFL